MGRLRLATVKEVTSLLHRFKDASEARRALREDGDAVILILPARGAVWGDALGVRLGGRGGALEAVGLPSERGGELHVRFEAEEAAVVRGAIGQPGAGLAVRAHPRFACAVPAVVSAGRAQVAAVACDVGLGGARLLGLSAPLSAGARVPLALGGGAPIGARVVWASGMAAGLAFTHDPVSRAAAERALDMFAAGKEHQAA